MEGACEYLAIINYSYYHLLLIIITNFLWSECVSIWPCMSWIRQSTGSPPLGSTWWQTDPSEPASTRLGDRTGFCPVAPLGSDSRVALLWPWPGPLLPSLWSWTARHTRSCWWRIAAEMKVEIFCSELFLQKSTLQFQTQGRKQRKKCADKRLRRRLTHMIAEPFIVPQQAYFILRLIRYFENLTDRKKSIGTRILPLKCFFFKINKKVFFLII